ncbi:MAG: hypothetical protein ABEJ79_02690 [Halolamina sp.]
MTGTERPLIRTLFDVSEDVDLALELADGDRVVGRPSRIDRDQAGIRIEVCPFSGEAPQYRVRANRTPTGWQTPVVERRPLGGDWTRQGALAGVKTLLPPPS